MLADLSGNVKIRMSANDLLYSSNVGAGGQEWCDVGTIYPALNGLMSFTHHIMFPWRFNEGVARLDKWPETSTALGFWRELTAAVSTKSLVLVIASEHTKRPVLTLHSTHCCSFLGKQIM